MTATREEDGMEPVAMNATPIAYAGISPEAKAKADQLETKLNALSTPATEPQGYVEVDPVESICASVRSLIADARAERDRFGNIAATIRINALHHGATNAEVDAMLSGELDFIKWVCAKVEAHTTSSEHEPQSCLEDDGCPTENAVLKRFWREHQALASRHAPQPAADTPALNDELATMISDLSHTGELSMLYRMEIAGRITDLLAIIATATPAPSDKIAEAARVLLDAPDEVMTGFAIDVMRANRLRDGKRIGYQPAIISALRALAGKGE